MGNGGRLCCVDVSGVSRKGLSRVRGLVHAYPRHSALFREVTVLCASRCVQRCQTVREVQLLPTISRSVGSNILPVVVDVTMCRSRILVVMLALHELCVKTFRENSWLSLGCTAVAGLVQCTYSGGPLGLCEGERVRSAGLKYVLFLVAGGSGSAVCGAVVLDRYFVQQLCHTFTAQRLRERVRSAEGFSLIARIRDCPRILWGVPSVAGKVRNAPENLVTRTSEADPAQQQKIDTILRGTLSVGVDRDLLATAGNFSGFASYSFEGSSRHRACPPDIVHVVDFLKRQFTWHVSVWTHQPDTHSRDVEIMPSTCHKYILSNANSQPTRFRAKPRESQANAAEHRILQWQQWKITR